MRFNTYFQFLILALLFTACNNFNSNDDGPCQRQEPFGEFPVAESTFENGHVYDLHDAAIFENQDGQTISLDVLNNQAFSRGERIVLVECMEDPTQNVQVEYVTEFRQILLGQQSFDVNTEFTSISLDISSILYLDDPAAGLVGDFINVTGFGNQGDFNTLSIMLAPINLRTFPGEIDEMESYDYIEEIELNGIIYNNVFVSNETSEAIFKIYMTIEDGIIRIEESDGIVWSFIRYE